MNSVKLVEVATFSFPHQAHIAKASLEAAEIPSIITNEHLINMQWLYSNALGGVRLLVPKQLSSAAKDLLAIDFSESLNDFVDIENTLCPDCNSTNVEPYTIGKKPAFIIFLLFGFPLFFLKSGIKCLDCNAINTLDKLT